MPISPFSLTKVGAALRTAALSLVLLGLSLPTWAEYRQAAGNGAALYDAPSNKSTGLFILSAGTPVEVILNVAGWVKVRDASGTQGWTDPTQLTQRSNVQVNAPIVEVRTQASASAPIAFVAEKDVLLSAPEAKVEGGWVRVSHRSGVSGYARADALFGL